MTHLIHISFNYYIKHESNFYKIDPYKQKYLFKYD